eukprot:TRINITY_DN12049_c0_g2_i1.p1 TRINITY_DN12049_c0_g2~~TRINITY_DN12049_c0_g2_i1.p1  ORF type:complete len:123 (+),score=21.11 TRINITY_DN12049_c0_g2_i1:183-551(+)
MLQNLRRNSLRELSNRQNSRKDFCRFDNLSQGQLENLIIPKILEGRKRIELGGKGQAFLLRFTLTSFQKFIQQFSWLVGQRSPPDVSPSPLRCRDMVTPLWKSDDGNELEAKSPLLLDLHPP